MNRIDFETPKHDTDLLKLAGGLTSLKRVASTQGGEYAGPCPFCSDHGKDRFRVQPYRRPYGLWMCRHCTDGMWKDAVDLGRRLWPGEDLHHVCMRLSSGMMNMNSFTHEPHIHNNKPAYQPPPIHWQKAAQRAIKECQDALWSPKMRKVLDYLYSRGLTDGTISNFRLGYCSTGSKNTFGRYFDGLWIPRGIVIPCSVANEIWYLKIRLVPEVPIQCQKCKTLLAGPSRCSQCGTENKYRGVHGNKPSAIFNADNLFGYDIALLCEGEFDCMIAHQELNDVIPCITAGSAGNHLDLAAWGSHLRSINYPLVVFDNDPVGVAGAKKFLESFRRGVYVSLPAGVKDLNALYLYQGHLFDFFVPYFEVLIKPEINTQEVKLPRTISSLSNLPESIMAGDGRK